MFNPYVYTLVQPRGQMAMPQPSQAAQQQPREVTVSVVAPLARTIDLSTVSGIETPVAGTLYTRDYFLAHYTAAAIQRVHISSSAAANQSKPLGLRFVAKKGQEVTELTPFRYYGVTPIDTETIDDELPQFEGALFLRVRGVSQITELYVTLEVLTSEVI